MVKSKAIFLADLRLALRDEILLTRHEYLFGENLGIKSTQNTVLITRVTSRGQKMQRLRKLQFNLFIW